MNISLKKITPENFEDIIKIKVSDKQKEFVSSVLYSLAQAYVYRENAFPFSIYKDDIPIGFIMFGFYEQRKQYTLWKFLVDKEYQHKGYGKAALLIGIECMKSEYGVREMYTGVSLNNTVAEQLYKSVGFRLTGIVENGMKELKCVFE